MEKHKASLSSDEFMVPKGVFVFIDIVSVFLFITLYLSLSLSRFFSFALSNSLCSNAEPVESEPLRDDSFERDRFGLAAMPRKSESPPTNDIVSLCLTL